MSEKILNVNIYIYEDTERTSKLKFVCSDKINEVNANIYRFFKMPSTLLSSSILYRMAY